MDLIRLCFVLLLAIVKTREEIVSPCPNYFVFEPNKSEDDRWYGIIKLESKKTIKDITLDLKFDKSIIQLGNFFGPLTSDEDNINFRITSSKKEITPAKPLKVEIYAVYDPYIDVVPPKLIKIQLNGREICPNYVEETIITEDNNTPSLVTFINQENCGTAIVTTIGLITHGQNTAPGQWPWHAAIYRKEGNNRNYICGGTLISEQHVLTAAHCTTLGENPRNPQDFIVVLGKYGLWVDGKQEQTFHPTKVIVHQGFNRSNFFNDISILHLNAPSQYTQSVRPACLWSQSIDLGSVVHQVGTAVGWGRDHEQNPTTDLLMMANMPVVDRLECIYSHRQFYPLFINDNNFCAGFRNGTSVCNGDSGGGLFFPKSGTSGPTTVWELRGIVSNTVAKHDGTCDPKYYVIFTDVAKYLDWIKDKLTEL